MPLKNTYELIDLIRERPGMYLGEASIIRMQAYLHGYEHAERDLEVGLPTTPSWHNFHDWVAGYYGWECSQAGWCNMIMEHSGNDEKTALDQFYKLTDQFRISRLQVVSSITTESKHQPTGQVKIQEFPDKGAAVVLRSFGDNAPPPKEGRVRKVPPQITIATHFTASVFWFLRYHYEDEVVENRARSESDAKDQARDEFGIKDDEWVNHAQHE